MISSSFRVDYATQISIDLMFGEQNYNLQIIAPGYFGINTVPTYQAVLESLCMGDCLLHQSGYNREPFPSRCPALLFVWKHWQPIAADIFLSCPALGSFRHFKQKATPELLVEVFEIILRTNGGVGLCGLGSVDILGGLEGKLLALDATSGLTACDGG